MIKVHYKGINKTVEAPEGMTVLDVSLENQIRHVHECGGNGRCTTCRIHINKGMESVSPPTPLEMDLGNRRGWNSNMRLACQCTIHGDIEVERLLWSSPEISRIQLESIPDGKAYERKVAILCCDMRGFTRISSEMMAFDTAHLLNNFYTALGEPILMNNGIIYQYVGDEIVGVFGAAGGDTTEICLSTVRAAMGMQYAAKRLNKYDLNAFNTDLQIGIGITYGKAFIGHLGHPKHRQFAVIGDTMNQASRIQQQTKIVKQNLLISDEVLNALPDKTLTLNGQFETLLDGKKEPAKLFAVEAFQKMDMHLELQHSMDKILDDEEGFASRFYEHLFNTLPEARELFKKNMQNQGKLLMHMLSGIVYALGRPGHLKMGLRSLGRNHSKYGVKKEHYPILIEAFLKTIKEQLGEEASPQTIEAWNDALLFITEVMKEGMH